MAPVGQRPMQQQYPTAGQGQRAGASPVSANVQQSSIRSASSSPSAVRPAGPQHYNAPGMTTQHIKPVQSQGMARQAPSPTQATPAPRSMSPSGPMAPRPQATQAMHAGAAGSSAYSAAASQHMSKGTTVPVVQQRSPQPQGTHMGTAQPRTPQQVRSCSPWAYSSY